MENQNTYQYVISFHYCCSLIGSLWEWCIMRQSLFIVNFTWFSFFSPEISLEFFILFSQVFFWVHNNSVEIQYPVWICYFQMPSLSLKLNDLSLPSNNCFFHYSCTRSWTGSRRWRWSWWAKECVSTKKIKEWPVLPGIRPSDFPEHQA